MKTQDTAVDSILPFPCFVAGVRGFNCPGLKLHGYYTLRQLERDGKKKLAQGRAKLAAQGIFLPAPVKSAWPSEAQLDAEIAALEARYGKSFLIYANLWEVERQVSAQDLPAVRAYRMAQTKALHLPLTHPETANR